MFRNKNKAPLSKLAFRSMKANKGRSGLLVLSILLTALLLTTVMTLTMSVMKSNEYTQMRRVGTKSHASYKHISQDQFDKISKHDSIDGYGKSVLIGPVTSEALKRRPVEIWQKDGAAMAFSWMLPLMKGRQPQGGNEVIVDTLLLDGLGLPYDLRQDITLDFQVFGTNHSEKFEVVGIYQGDLMSISSFMVVSDAFARRHLKDIDRIAAKEQGHYTGSIYMEIDLKTTYKLEDSLQSILMESGLENEDIAVGVNWAYKRAGNLRLEDCIVYVLFIVLIMVSGYLIIYNIFYIAICKDVKFYGLLRTLGTCKNQLRTYIFYQGLFLSCLGIPVGLLLGFALGKSLMPHLVGALNIEAYALSMHPMIFVVSGGLTLVTLVISCRKPSRMAFNISPLQAMRSVDRDPVKLRISKTRDGNKIKIMAWRNVCRNKKKTILVMASLSLSLLVLAMASSFMASIDEVAYLEDQINTDYTFASLEYYNSHADHNTNPMLVELLEEVKALDGFQEAITIEQSQSFIGISDKVKAQVIDTMSDTSRNYMYHNYITKNRLQSKIYGVDRKALEMLEAYVIEGEIDLAKMEKGGHIIITQTMMTDLGGGHQPFSIGQEIELGDQETRLKVMAIVDDLPQYLYDKRYSSYGLAGYISQEDGKRIFDEMTLISCMVNVDGDYKNQFHAGVQDIIRAYPLLDYRNRDLYIEEIDAYVRMVGLMALVLCGVLALIGFLNFVNMVWTNTLVRRREYAILKCVGMTSKQLLCMMILENVYLVVATGFLATLAKGAWGILFMDVPLKVAFLPGGAVVLLLSAMMVLGVSVPLIYHRWMKDRPLIQGLNGLE